MGIWLACWCGQVSRLAACARGLDLNQELGIEFEGPQFGFVGGIEATRP